MDRRPDVGARGLRGERRGIVRQWRVEQRLDRRPDAIDDGAQIRGLVALRLAQLLQRCGYGTALRMSHDDGQPRFEALGRELDAAHLRRRDDIARDADDEQVAKTLAEDELGWNARIGTAKYDGERLLPRAGTASRRCPVFHEAPIPLPQARQRFLTRDHVEG